jgi:hypothetical protein
VDDRELELSFPGQPAHFEADGDLDRDGSLTPQVCAPSPRGRGGAISVRPAPTRRA